LATSATTKKSAFVIFRRIDTPQRHGTGIDDVRALAMLGEVDKALETLAEAVAEGWRANWRLALELGSLDSIRGDPRFVAQQSILETEIAARLASYRTSRGIE